MKVRQAEDRSKLVIRYDEYITGLAKLVFGDIVEKAYIVIDANGLNREEIKAYLDFCSQTFKKARELLKDDNFLTYDGLLIWVRFANKRVVEFHCSDWATIVPVDPAEIEKSYEVH